MVVRDAAGTSRKAKRFKYAMLTAIALLLLTVAGGAIIALTSNAPTDVSTDPATGVLTVSGPESQFVGEVSGQFDGHGVIVRGLPPYRDLERMGDARRAVCAIRNDPAARWSESSDLLRAHLDSPEMDSICDDAV